MAISNNTQTVTPYIKQSGNYDKLLFPASSIVMDNGNDLETELKYSGSGGGGGATYTTIATGSFYSQYTNIQLSQSFTNFDEIIVVAGAENGSQGFTFNHYVVNCGYRYQKILFNEGNYNYNETIMTLLYDQNSPQMITIMKSSVTSNYSRITKVIGVKY